MPLSFGDALGLRSRKRTRREVFLAKMEQVVPCKPLLALIEPHDSKMGWPGCPPDPMATMLRIYFCNRGVPCATRRRWPRFAAYSGRNASFGLNVSRRSDRQPELKEHPNGESAGAREDVQRVEGMFAGKTATDRSNPVRPTARPTEEALDAEAVDSPGRGYYEHRAERRGYRSGHRQAWLMSTEDEIGFAVPQLADMAKPLRSEIHELLRGRTEELERLPVQMCARGLSVRDIEAAFTRESGRCMLSRTAASELGERPWTECQTFATGDPIAPGGTDGAPRPMRAIEEVLPGAPVAALSRAQDPKSPEQCARGSLAPADGRAPCDLPGRKPAVRMHVQGRLRCAL